MPKLQHVTADIYAKYPNTLALDPDVPSAVVYDIFGFPDRQYPTVTSFELENFELGSRSTKATMDLTLLFKCMPNLRALTLGSCNAINMVYKSPEAGADPAKFYVPHHLERLRMDYSGHDVYEMTTGDQSNRLLWSLNWWGVKLKELVIVSPSERHVIDAQMVYRHATLVTSKSILGV